MRPEQRQTVPATQRDALLSGLVGALISVVIVAVLSVIVPTPWTLGAIVIALGVSSFFAAYFTRYFAGRR